MLPFFFGAADGALFGVSSGDHLGRVILHKGLVYIWSFFLYYFPAAKQGITNKNPVASIYFLGLLWGELAYCKLVDASALALYSIRPAIRAFNKRSLCIHASLRKLCLTTPCGCSHILD
jgi:hypothetical protein